MLSPIFQRRRRAIRQLKRTATGAAQAAINEAGGAIEQTRQIYDVRLLTRGLLWISIYVLSRGMLELDLSPQPLRVLIALFPIPFFVWYLVTWMRGVARMDELQRQIELEALGFAFPAVLVILMTMGLLDVAVTLNPDDFRLRNTWLLLPMLYYVGLWRARRRYQ
jgi:hypothetical protein